MKHAFASKTPFNCLDHEATNKACLGFGKNTIRKIETASGTVLLNVLETGLQSTE